jgi:hypothetical protein
MRSGISFRISSEEIPLSFSLLLRTLNISALVILLSSKDSSLNARYDALKRMSVNDSLLIILSASENR